MASGRDSRASASSSQSLPGSLRYVRTPKRQRSAVFNNAPSDDKNTDFSCPICFKLIEEAHITRCGHTFCYQCIKRSLETMGRCPKCNFSLTGTDQIFPNFLLNDLITKYKQRTNGVEIVTDAPEVLRDFVAFESQNLTLPDVNVMLEILTQRKELLEAESCAAQNILLHEFLKHLLQLKEAQKNQLTREVALIKKDIQEVESILKDVHNKCPTLEQIERSVGDSEDAQVVAMKKEVIDLIDAIGSTTVLQPAKREKLNKDDSDETDSELSRTDNSLSTLAMRRRRMYANFDDFAQCYFNSRALYFGKESDKCDVSKNTIVDSTVGNSSGYGLDVFRENLVKFSRYNSLRPLATLYYSSDMYSNSMVVSSIEFDKDNEFFAIAGVTKRIKVYDYGAVIRDIVDIHYPSVEMESTSKVSCLSWNKNLKGTLVSSDYEGAVTVWDVSTGQKTKTFQEHEKRCWSVDFNNVDTRLIASGSDDAKVKLWSLNVDHSIATLEVKANVCCVKFNPKSSYHLAFGSADHCVHYYDLRNMKEPVAMFKGHRKAVSYVKFVNTEEIVSASTDGQLKMWNVNTPPHCLRSFVGHVNEKNFVGLATDGDYVACGSENNSLYVYYKGLAKQLLSFKFDSVRYVLEQERKDGEPVQRIDDVPGLFVSAVCWKQQSNVLVAANSQGIIKLLELVYGKPLKVGQARVFWGLDDVYQSVSVVGIRKPNSPCNELEELNEDKEAIRIAAGTGCKSLASVGIQDISIEDLGDFESAAEGATLATWTYHGCKSKDRCDPIAKIIPYNIQEPDQHCDSFERGLIKANAQNFARRLMETPANLMTPTVFACNAEELLSLGVTVTKRDKAWMESQKMGAFLSVTRGSTEPPVFLELEYRGPGADDKKPIVLVGKGVTFDSGGISIKSSTNMDHMRADMGGAACVVATIKAAAELKLAVKIKGLIPLCENMPSGHATKPGDVVYAMNGKSICVDNTDAEGRLILADALCYSKCFDPAWILDIATLTGAMSVALGKGATGVFTNSNALWDKLKEASIETGDRVWRFPLFKHYSDRVTKYSSYDVNNMGKGKGGGSCVAAAFLKEFVPENTDWLHLDIAGVMGPGDDISYLKEGMTGRPTRTLIEFIECVSQTKE